jgi:hypothetical protein
LFRADLVAGAGLTSLILKEGLYKKVFLPLFAMTFSFFLSQGKQASCFRKKEKALIFDQDFFVAGAGFEPTTFGL